MPTCPNGHDSQDSDFCDLCGIRINVPGAPLDTPVAPPSTPADPVPVAAVPPLDAAAADPCPMCGAARTGQFCEACGFDFATAPPSPSRPASTASPASSAAPAPPASSPATPASTAAGDAAGTAPAGGWTAVVTADREYFDRVQSAGGPDAGAIEFPAYCPERRFPLTGREMRIGRRSASRGLEPEIDLTGPPADPGISRLHAVLTAEPGGGWAVLDPGSANGTQVNGREITPGERVPLHDGDRICLGGWTALTIAAD